MVISESSKDFANIGIALFASASFSFSNLHLPDKQVELIAQTLASTAGTILGFLITAIALMASVMDRSLLSNLRATGGYQVLIRRGFICAALHLCLLTCSIALLFPFEKQALIVSAVFLAAAAAVYLASAGIGFYRVIMSMSRTI